jgi:hypothetical protein
MTDVPTYGPSHRGLIDRDKRATMVKIMKSEKSILCRLVRESFTD